MIQTVNQLTFKQEVLSSSMPVLVSFWAPWCGACRLVAPMLSDLQGKWGQQIKLVRINSDENLHLASTYRLTNLPTVILFAQGKILCRLEQFRDRDDFKAAAANLQTTLESVMLDCPVSAR